LIHPKILAWRPYARPLAGFKEAASRRRGNGKGRGGAEREKRVRKGKGGGRKVGTGPPIG